MRIGLWSVPPEKLTEPRSQWDATWSNVIGACVGNIFLEQISPNNGSLLILHHQYQTKYAIQETSAMAFPFWEVGLSICDSEPMGSLSSPSLPGAWPWASPAGPAVRQIEMFPLEPLLWGGLELRMQVRRDNGIKNKRQLCISKNCNSKSTGNGFFLPARLVTTAPTRRINKIFPQANQLQGSCYHDHMCGGLATLVPKANVTRFFLLKQ